jgi:hypothetical protein
MKLPGTEDVSGALKRVPRSLVGAWPRDHCMAIGPPRVAVDREFTIGR